LTGRSKLRFALMAAMALLVAQFAAQAHTYSHLRPGSDRTDQSSDSRARLCSECLSFAPLLATAGSTGQLPVVAAAGVSGTIVAVVASLISRAPLLAFRSRAPPQNP
jgi:hypothetical protein